MGKGSEGCEVFGSCSSGAQMPWRKDGLRAERWLDVRCYQEHNTEEQCAERNQGPEGKWELFCNLFTTYSCQLLPMKPPSENTHSEMPPLVSFHGKKENKSTSVPFTLWPICWESLLTLLYRFKLFVFCFNICGIIFQSNNKLLIPLTVITIRASTHPHLPLRVQKGNKQNCNKLLIVMKICLKL